MLRLKREQLAELSETLRDLANLVFGAFVLGQFLAQEPLSWWLLLVGLLSWVLLVSFALVLSGGRPW